MRNPTLRKEREGWGTPHREVEQHYEENGWAARQGTKQWCGARALPIPQPAMLPGIASRSVAADGLLCQRSALIGDHFIQARHARSRIGDI